MSFRCYENLTDKEWLKLLRKNPYLLALKKEQSEEFQIKFITNLFTKDAINLPDISLFVPGTNFILSLLKKPTKKVLQYINELDTSCSSYEDFIDYSECDDETLSYALSQYYAVLFDIEHPDQKLVESSTSTCMSYFLENRGLKREGRLVELKPFSKRAQYTNFEIELEWMARNMSFNGANLLLCRHIDDEEKLRKIIQVYPYQIVFVDNPSEELQLTAVLNSPEVLSYILNPTHRVQEELFKRCLTEREKECFLEGLYTEDLCDSVKEYLKQFPEKRRFKKKIMDEELFFLSAKNQYDRDEINACLTTYGDKLVKRIIKKYNISELINEDIIWFKFFKDFLTYDQILDMMRKGNCGELSSEGLIYKYDIPDEDIMRRPIIANHTPQILNLLSDENFKIAFSKLLRSKKIDNSEALLVEKYLSEELIDQLFSKIKNGRNNYYFYHLLFFVLNDRQKKKYGKRLDKGKPSSTPESYKPHILNYSRSNAYAGVKAALVNVLKLKPEMITKKILEYVIQQLPTVHDALEKEAIAEFLLKNVKMSSGQRLLLEVNRLLC